jgi:hypothetical protein
MQFIGFGKIGFEFETAWITVLRGFLCALVWWA